MPSAIDVNSELGKSLLDLFRQYLSLFAKEQAFCHFSDGLISNLERYWNAQSRTTKIDNYDPKGGLRVHQGLATFRLWGAIATNVSLGSSPFIPQHQT